MYASLPEEIKWGVRPWGLPHHMIWSLMHVRIHILAKIDYNERTKINALRTARNVRWFTAPPSTYTLPRRTTGGTMKRAFSPIQDNLLCDCWRKSWRLWMALTSPMGRRGSSFLLLFFCWFIILFLPVALIEDPQCCWSKSLRLSMSSTNSMQEARMFFCDFSVDLLYQYAYDHRRLTCVFCSMMTRSCLRELSIEQAMHVTQCLRGLWGEMAS